MSTAQSPLPDDHPIMLAWNAYKASFDFVNVQRWATAIELRQSATGASITFPHRDGSLWAAFLAGYQAASNQATGAAGEGGDGN